MINYADDIVLYLLTDEKAEHVLLLAEFVHWCKDFHVILNTSKTKEMHINFRRKSSPAQPTVQVEIRVP